MATQRRLYSDAATQLARLSGRARILLGPWRKMVDRAMVLAGGSVLGTGVRSNPLRPKEIEQASEVSVSESLPGEI